MKEEIFSLPLCGKFTLHGRINRAAQPTNKAVIFCHGLTGHMYEHQYMLARSYFTERGYDTIRFNFYGDERDARRIIDCTVALHAEDLKILLAHFGEQYKSLYVCGHSYGGLTILIANAPQITAASLWDGTFIPFVEKKHFCANWFFNQELGEHMITWLPIVRVVGTKFYEEMQTFTSERMINWAKNVFFPTQVVAAGGFPENIPYQQKMHESLGSTEKEFVSIAEASHGFNEGATVFELLENTYRWFERF